MKSFSKLRGRLTSRSPLFRVYAGNFYNAVGKGTLSARAPEPFLSIVRRQRKLPRQQRDGNRELLRAVLMVDGCNYLFQCQPDEVYNSRVALRHKVDGIKHIFNINYLQTEAALLHRGWLGARRIIGWGEGSIGDNIAWSDLLDRMYL